jgi:hypothetical protein
MGHSDYHPQMVGSLLALPHLYPIMYPLCIHYVSIMYPLFFTTLFPIGPMINMY